MSKRRPAHRSLLLVALLCAPATLACSDQGEGERCDLAGSGIDGSGQGRDCEDGLTCVDAELLLANDGADRCCPPEDEPFSDSRCRRTVSSSSSGGGTGGNAGGAGMSQAAGGGGTAGGAGSPSGGTGGTAGGAGTSRAGASNVAGGGTGG